MHVELADLFRCPEAHAESWLVLAADRTERRAVLEGVLGCPVCGAEYRIAHGVTYFGDASDRRVSAAGERTAPPELAEAQAMRAAALLNATDATATLGFVGESIAVVRAVQGIVAARCIAFDAPDAHDAHRWYAVSDAPFAVVAGGRQPMARGALSGLWLAPGAALHLEQLRPRGRLVAPVARSIPDGFTELARDDTQWVAERTTVPGETTTAPGGLTQIRRRR